jgi:hypothetical protein
MCLIGHESHERALSSHGALVSAAPRRQAAIRTASRRTALELHHACSCALALSGAKGGSVTRTLRKLWTMAAHPEQQPGEQPVGENARPFHPSPTPDRDNDCVSNLDKAHWPDFVRAHPSLRQPPSLPT